MSFPFSFAAPPGKVPMNQLTPASGVPLVTVATGVPPTNTSTSKPAESPSKTTPAKSMEIQPLTDISVPLETIKPGM